MFCQCCDVEAPTRYVEFYQNIGALFIRWTKSVKGNLCKRCIHKTFWKMTATNLVLGWWGTISFFMTIGYLCNNIARYVGCIGLPPVPAGAAPAQLSMEAWQKLQPFTNDIYARFQGGQQIAQVSNEIAAQAGVTPGQVVLYVRSMIEASKQQQQVQQ